MESSDETWRYMVSEDEQERVDLCSDSVEIKPSLEGSVGIIHLNVMVTTVVEEGWVGFEPRALTDRPHCVGRTGDVLVEEDQCLGLHAGRWC